MMLFCSRYIRKTYIDVKSQSIIISNQSAGLARKTNPGKECIQIFITVWLFFLSVNVMF